MYLQNELLMSVPLVLYAAWRLRTLLAGPILKNLSTSLFALLAAGYPLAEGLSHGTSEGPQRIVVLAGYYALPLLLYLVMTVLATDLIVGAMRLSRAAGRKKVWSDGFRRGRLAVVLAVPAVVVAAGIANANILRAREYTVDIPRRSSPLRELRIVFASDLHLGAMTPKGWLAGFVDKVNAQRPDVILLGGDLLEGHRDGLDMGAVEAQFRRLESRYGVFAVPGNHEGYAGTRADFFERSRIRFLQDEAAAVDGAFILAGRRDFRRGARKSIEALLGGAPDGLPVIVLSHRPVDMESVGRSRAGLQLSGHTHHGQLFPVNFITTAEYGLSWGHRKTGNTHFIVSSGAWLWGPPVRTAGASEILVVHVRFTNVP